MKTDDVKFKVIISGGGTGGHIFPALAIANGIKDRYPNADILFVGAKGKMEMEKVPKAGFNIIGLNVEGFKTGSKIKNIPVIFKFLFSVLKAGKIVKEYKPKFVVGVGGYASGALILAASRKSVPILIQEQNSLPGKTNIMLGKHAKRICVAYEGLDKYFSKEQIIMTGNPIRKEFINIQKKTDEAYEYFGIIEKSKPVLLIVGGSQGALAINEAVAKDIDKLVQAGMFVIWQTGKSFLPQSDKVLNVSNMSSIWHSDFIYRMDLAYSVADLVVSRSGAIALSELCVVGLPSILVPLPTAAENHQMKNALAIADKGAALIVENQKASTELSNVVLKVINDKHMLTSLGNNIKKLAITDSVDRIVNIIDSEFVHPDK